MNERKDPQKVVVVEKNCKERKNAWVDFSPICLPAIHASFVDDSILGSYLAPGWKCFCRDVVVTKVSCCGAHRSAQSKSQMHDGSLSRSLILAGVILLKSECEGRSFGRNRKLVAFLPGEKGGRSILVHERTGDGRAQ